MACTTQAQLSTLPKRYRSGNGKIARQEIASDELSGGFGRRLSHHSQRKMSSTKQERKTNLRKNVRELSVEELSMSLSLPLDARSFDISMSMPSIEQLDFSMSMDQAAFDLMSMSMSMPTLIDVPAETELESVSLDNGSSTGSKLVVASVVAGISALVILGAALFAKSARSRKTEETRAVSSEEGQLQQVPFDLSSEDSK